MIEHDFSSSEGSEPIGFSGIQFELIVEALNNAAGNGLPGTKPIEKKLSMGTKHSRHFLHGLNSGPADSPTPAVQEYSRPVGRNIIPEKLKIFLEQITAYGPEVTS